MPEFTTRDAFVLSVRPLGERSYILSLFTKEQGRHLGVVKAKTPPEVGSILHARWRSRLADQMGTYYIEPSQPLSILYLDDQKRLASLLSIGFLLDKLIPERQAYAPLYDDLFSFLTELDAQDFIARYIKLEILLLEALGFGLDMTGCAGGGKADELAYISPKTGRAVSKSKGVPYHDKLLPLPAFLWKNGAEITKKDLSDGLNLAAYFLTTYAHLKELPKIRERLYR
ncbi:MAG: DNA repair protein RecO [Lactobacillales bacterium]|jgi:DNA repair protein RecO (recombination protein O)|nr:DNA repair protein RecO [Lactobacillales bacterium]